VSSKTKCQVDKSFNVRDGGINALCIMIQEAGVLFIAFVAKTINYSLRFGAKIKTLPIIEPEE